MLILGLLSLLQIVFLPGFLMLRSMRMNDGMLKTIILSFPLSLVMNYCMVLLLTFFHFYTRPSIYAVFAVECLVLIRMTLPLLRKPIGDLINSDLMRIKDLSETVRNSKPSVMLIKVFFMVLSIVTLLDFATNLLNTWGTIFDSVDAVFSWNRWAVEWAGGHFPTATWHYPQLLPANWSLTYVFLGDYTVQFFAKISASFFPLLIVLTILDLGLRTKQFGYIIAIFVTGLILSKTMGGAPGMSNGYADVPVAFMSFVSVYLILLSDYSDSKEEIKKNLMLGSICCSGAALTKQAGLYLFLLYPVLCYFIVLHNMPKLSGKEKMHILIVTCITMVVLVAPWYAYTEVLIRHGSESSEITYVTTGIHEGMTLGRRLFKAVYMLEERLFAPDLYPKKCATCD